LENYAACFCIDASIFEKRRKRDDETSRECITDAGEEECIKEFGGRARKKEATRKT
jgi:hypothetical protein